MKNNVDIFKKIVLFYIIFLISLVCFYFFEGFSSGSDDILNNDIDEPWLLLDTIITVSIIIYFYILFLLYKLKPLGKKLFLPFLILFEVLAYFSFDFNDFIYDNKLKYYLDYLDYFLMGVIITFLYFTDVKKEFEKKKKELFTRQTSLIGHSNFFI